MSVEFDWMKDISRDTVSPQAKIDQLRTENAKLKKQLQAAKLDRVNLIGAVLNCVSGMKLPPNLKGTQNGEYYKLGCVDVIKFVNAAITQAKKGEK